MRNHWSSTSASQKTLEASVVDFRGVELVADTNDNKMTLRAAGNNQQKEIPFTFATNTVYTILMRFDVASSTMEVGINRFPPETIGIPKALHPVSPYPSV